MNSTTFDSLRRALSEHREEIVKAKRPEYTEGNPDVLRNFKVVANELGIDPIKVWYVYFRKHVASISQFATDPKRVMAEPIDERIADAMNYLELLYALVKEDKDVQSPAPGIVIPVKTIYPRMVPGVNC